jgi:hypothetical protein
VEDVRAQAVGVQVSDRGISRELVGAQERRVVHARRFAHALTNELVEGHAARSLGDQREHHVAAVVVREPLAGCETAGVAVEHHEVLLRRRELLHGNRHHVVRCFEGVLVEVVADAGPVRQQVFDGDGVVDQREIRAQHGARRGRQIERARLDQAHDRERREALRAARDAEPSIGRVRDPVRAIGEPVRALEDAVGPGRPARRRRNRCRMLPSRALT